MRGLGWLAPWDDADGLVPVEGVRIIHVALELELSPRVVDGEEEVLEEGAPEESVHA